MPCTVFAAGVVGAWRVESIEPVTSPSLPMVSRLAVCWLGAGHDPLRAVSLEPVLPPMLAGATTAGAALPLDGLTLLTGPLAGVIGSASSSGSGWTWSSVSLCSSREARSRRLAF